MKKWFGARPSPVRLDVSVGRGPLPRFEPKQPGAFLRDRSVRNARPSGGRVSWVRTVVIALVAIVGIVAMRLVLAWYWSR
jgi:hypothetical protein